MKITSGTATAGQHSRLREPLPAFAVSFTGPSPRLPATLTLARSTTACCQDKSGYWQTAAIDAPRFGFLFGHGPGLVVEEAITARNSYARPSAGTTANHFSTGAASVTVATDSDNPGKNLATGTAVWECDNSGGGAPLTLEWAGGTTTTASHSGFCYVRLIGGDAPTLSIKGKGSQTTAPGPAGYTLHQIVGATGIASGDTLRLVVPAGAKIRFTCANLQVSALYLTSLIDTAGAAVTRSGDTLNMAATPFTTATRGTVTLRYRDLTPSQQALSAPLLYLGDGTAANRYLITKSTSGTFQQAHNTANVSSSVGNASVALAGGFENSLALQWDTVLKQTRLYHNGILVIERNNPAVTMPAATPSNLRLFGRSDSAVSRMNVVLETLAVYTAYLPQQRLIRDQLTLQAQSIVPAPSCDAARPVVLFAGQSNSSGIPANTGTYAHAPALIGNDGVLKPYTDPYDSNTGQIFSGFADATAAYSYAGTVIDDLIGLTGESWTAMPANKGATALKDAWNPLYASDAELNYCGLCFRLLIQHILIARRHGRLRVLVWHQGEQDAADNTMTQAAYTALLQNFLAQLSLYAPEAAIVLVSLHDAPAAGYPKWAEVQSAQNALTVPGVTIVPASGKSVIAGDTVHLSATGLTALGHAIAAAIAAL